MLAKYTYIARLAGKWKWYMVDLADERSSTVGLSICAQMWQVVMGGGCVVQMWLKLGIAIYVDEFTLEYLKVIPNVYR